MLLSLVGIVTVVCRWSLAVVLRRLLAAGIVVDREPVQTRVDRLIQQAGLPSPTVRISATTTPTAATVGSRPSISTIVISQRLVELLPDRELNAVLAHEFARLTNRDARSRPRVSSLKRFARTPLCGGVLDRPAAVGGAPLLPPDPAGHRSVDVQNTSADREADRPTSGTDRRVIDRSWLGRRHADNKKSFYTASEKVEQSQRIRDVRPLTLSSRILDSTARRERDRSAVGRTRDRCRRHRCLSSSGSRHDPRSHCVARRSSSGFDCRAQHRRRARLLSLGHRLSRDSSRICTRSRVRARRDRRRTPGHVYHGP
ncbi:peptidase M48 Ste24p [Natrinema gari JCM 14663]|uniref:Peptidase M48 Ste24p n=1 Tax=Natrinema gari JCM 14663 TaxID=1230459 RepID=L9YU15_9EURY|nr:peptidase M48 Ste24p [Natrinema gari JCM 14663]